jgi:1-acyl-sn-glycerol-3-phosphate acyltransferase
MLYRMLGRVEIAGLENVPRSGAYVAAINHTSLFDAPLMLSFWPQTIAAIGAADVFEKPVQGKIVSWYGTTPVHRGSYDRALLDDVLATLRSGVPLLIAPEGGRSHSPAMRRARPGIAYVVDETGVAVVPVGILGATDDFL